MTFVIQFKNGNLYCLDCGERVDNTANAEMRNYGSYSYSHSCSKNEGVRDRIRKEINYKYNKKWIKRGRKIWK